MTAKTKRKKRRKNSPKTILKNRLDRAFSRFIRLSHYDKEKGYVECFTCGKKADDIVNIHCGHFMSRIYLPTRWDVRNCKPQCASCNTYRQGEQYIFSLKLGEKLAYTLYRKSRDTWKPSEEWLKFKVDHYERKVKKLEEELFGN